jgi:O-antigen/teichoic acid export membrane protein
VDDAARPRLTAAATPERSSSYGRGARVLSLGIATTGLVTFAYFSVASYVLGDADYTRVALLWSVMFVIVSVIYRPIEQLLSRTIADRRARGIAGEHPLRTPLLLQASFALGFLAIALALRERIQDDVFDGSPALYWILVAGVLAYAASYFARGWLAGHQWFGLYGALVLLESCSRFLFALAVAVGIASGQSAVALGMAAAPFVSLVVVPWAFRRGETARPGARAARDQLGLGRGGRFALAVFAVTLAEQTLLNAAVLTAEATAADAAVAGFVFNVLLIARAPLQLFQAIQGALLPHLAGLTATAGHAEFARAVRVTVLAIAAFAGAVALGLLAIGPWAMDLLFEDEITYGRWGLGLVAVGMGAHLVAGTLNQAALARDRAGAAAAAWLLAAAAFVGWMLAPVVEDELLRAEVGYAGAAGLLCALLAAVYRRWTLAVGGLLVLALALRLWGITWGLPFTYNVDERAHFAPKAVEFFSGDLNPHYQLNPSGFSYVLALVFAVWFRGADAVRSAYGGDPTEAFLVGRVAAALLGTASVWLTYLAGARLFGRWPGLLAGGLMAVAFLPVFYAHQALNDAPTLAPVALALLGAALVLRRGRMADYALAGLAAGLAAGFKYNAGVIALALAAAALVRFLDGERGRSVRGLALGTLAAVVGFLVCDPYALLDFATFREALDFLVDYNAREPTIGEPGRSGWAYYAWTLTWGLGWVPLALAVGGALLLGVRDRRAFVVLVPVAVLFFLYMGSQGRFFGRYMLPAFPALCLLAGYGGVALVRALSAGRARLAVPLGAAVAVAALAQGLVASVHADLVLARKDTRTQTREWMLANVAPGTRIVVEPSVPVGWFVRGAHPDGEGEPIWDRWQRPKALVRELRREHRGAGRRADFQNYVWTLFPGMLDVYRREGACTYVRVSTQAGRAFREPERVPQAVAFYRALDREARVLYEANPFGRGEPAQPFQFDLSFNFLPLAYERPGPVLRVYRLRDCR